MFYTGTMYCILGYILRITKKTTFLGGPQDQFHWYSDGPANAEMILPHWTNNIYGLNMMARKTIFCQELDGPAHFILAKDHRWTPTIGSSGRSGPPMDPYDRLVWEIGTTDGPLR